MQLNLNKKKFIDEENLKTIVKIGINFGEKLNALESETIADYDNTKTYLKGESCYHNNYIYRCKATATGDWDFSRWELIGDEITELTKDDIKDMLGLSDEELETLSKIILDSEVRLDKTYSSSKIYTDIQNAIDTAKAYTLTELGKISGASYKIASSTSDMTDEKVIYLLQNNTTFDMYIVESGTPTKIGDTNIDLSGYLKIDDANNIYLKKTDATSTYATKIELDDKVDKTSIKTAISTTPSNDNVLSEKYIDENIVKKSDIATTLNSTSTDDKVPSAKAVNTLLNNKANKMVMKSSQNVDDLVDEGSYYVIEARNAPEAYGWIDVLANTNYTIQLFYPSINANCEMYIRRRQAGGAWESWQKVCTTGVKDVPVTNIAPSDTTTFLNFAGNSYTNYYVRNGVCYVTIWNVKIASNGRTIQTGVFLPLPANNRAGTLLAGNGDAIPRAFVYVIGDTGELCFDVKDANANLFGSFSYPVSES